MKIGEMFTNTKFWIKNNIFVKPALWIDSKYSEDFGYSMYTWTRRITWWLMLIVLPILIIVLTSLTASYAPGTDSGMGNVIFTDSPLFAASTAIMWSWLGVWGASTLLWFWFRKFKNIGLVDENTLTDIMMDGKESNIMMNNLFPISISDVDKKNIAKKPSSKKTGGGNK